jgi:hypothetical protein
MASIGHNLYDHLLELITPHLQRATQFYAKLSRTTSERGETAVVRASPNVEIPLE